VPDRNLWADEDRSMWADAAVHRRHASL
jgi:hypothetical protein